MVHKSLVGILIAIVLVGLFWWLSGTDEDRIRGLIRNLESDFNRTKASALISNFASDYEDENTGVDRDDLLNTFRATFLRDRDQGEYQYEVQLLEEPEIAIADDAESATATGELMIRYRGSGNTRWRIALTLDFVKHEGDWLVRRSRWKTLEGRHPF